MFEVEYTIFAGLIGSTFITMATHGTDQDMVQRMLTAPDIRRSRRSLILSGLADIPIVLTFLTIGLLLWTYYQAHPDPTLPKTPNETAALSAKRRWERVSSELIIFLKKEVSVKQRRCSLFLGIA